MTFSNEILKAKESRSRDEAVFECIDGFLTDQLQQQQEERGEDEPKTEVASPVVVSVVIFNEKAVTLLERMPLVGDGRKVRKALHTARTVHTPKGGTFFTAGFERTQLLATPAGCASKNPIDIDSLSNTYSNVVVVFLSDGRPGDLQQHPPKNESIPMQETFRWRKKSYPAAGQFIEKMNQQYNNTERHSNKADGPASSRLSLNFVCLYDEGRKVRRFNLLDFETVYLLVMSY